MRETIQTTYKPALVTPNNATQHNNCNKKMLITTTKETQAKTCYNETTNLQIIQNPRSQHVTPKTNPTKAQSQKSHQHQSSQTVVKTTKQVYL